MKIFIITFCIIASCNTILSQRTELPDNENQGSGTQTGGGNRKHDHHHHSDDLKTDQVDLNSTPLLSPIEKNEQQEISEPKLAIQETPSGIPIIPSGTPPSDVCNLQMEVGPCRAAFPRFYFIASKADCEPFLYGGCEGNYNNFATYDECMQFCTTGYVSQSPILPEFVNKDTEARLLETNQQFTSSDATNNNDNNNESNNNNENSDNDNSNNDNSDNDNSVNDNDNESSSGNRHHHRWPIFGGLLAGFYSLLRHLFYW